FAIPTVELLESDLNLITTAVQFSFQFFAIVLFEWRQQRKRDVHRLEVPGIGVRDVVRETAHRGGSWRRDRFPSLRQHRCVPSSHQPGSHRFDVSFHSRDLPGKKDSPIVAHLQSLVQYGGSADECVAMYLSIAYKLRLFEPRNQPQHSLLLSELQMVL